MWGVWIRWSGTVEWNGGMEYWTGILEFPLSSAKVCVLNIP